MPAGRAAPSRSILRPTPCRYALLPEGGARAGADANASRRRAASRPRFHRARSSPGARNRLTVAYQKHRRRLRETPLPFPHLSEFLLSHASSLQVLSPQVPSPPRSNARSNRFYSLYYLLDQATSSLFAPPVFPSICLPCTCMSGAPARPRAPAVIWRPRGPGCAHADDHQLVWLQHAHSLCDQSSCQHVRARAHPTAPSCVPLPSLTRRRRRRAHAPRMTPMCS